MFRILFLIMFRSIPYICKYLYTLMYITEYNLILKTFLMVRLTLIEYFNILLIRIF